MHLNRTSPEEVELGVELAVAGHDVLVLVLAELPGDGLLGHPVLVLDLVERRVLQLPRPRRLLPSTEVGRTHLSSVDACIPLCLPCIIQCCKLLEIT